MPDPGSSTALRGNIFEALDLEDAPELQVRVALAAALAHEVRRVMGRDQVSQRSIADAVGLHPTDLSKLVNGVVGEFSQERLQRALVKLGCEIDIRVRRSEDRDAGGVRVDASELAEPVV